MDFVQQYFQDMDPQRQQLVTLVLLVIVSHMMLLAFNSYKSQAVARRNLEIGRKVIEIRRRREE